MDRKTFIRKTAGTLLLTVLAYALLSCSSSSDDSNSTSPTSNNPDCLANGTTTVINNNTVGHSFTVSIADVNAGVRKVYNITGSASHSHLFVISEDMFTTLKTGVEVRQGSTTFEGHVHSVNVLCK